MSDAGDKQAFAALEARVREAAASNDDGAVWSEVEPLLAALADDAESVRCLLRIVNDGLLPNEQAADALAAIAAARPDDDQLLGSIGVSLECARDIDNLNAAPPAHPVFADVVRQLADGARRSLGREDESSVLSGLATAARMSARQYDDITERSYRRLVELDPGNSAKHYNLGLFYKTRGRFLDGMLANQKAIELDDETVESFEWNLGICATGAGEAAVALEVWRRMGQKMEIGRFGLPDGGYPQCKVRLAERPLAERGQAQDDPGLEETIWIQRLSPCHGIIRSVLYQDLGIDYGDVILFDGAPITYHRYGETDVPVFPHLATLVRNDYQVYTFAGTQDAAGRIEEVSADLAGDAVIYSHTENFQQLCSTCWRDPELDHEHNEVEEHHVVTGRIAAPREIEPAALLEQLDAALREREPCRVYAPELSAAAGRSERVAFERRRFEILTGA